jgi:hypothetical protein
MPEPIERLVFVYNADGSALSLLLDAGKKLLGLGDCALCDLTHGRTGERAEWKACRVALGVPVDLLHRDELRGALAELVGRALPAVVAITRSGPRCLLGPEDIARCGGSIGDLRGVIHQHAARRDLSL